LNTRSDRLGYLGRHEQASAAVEEAVGKVHLEHVFAAIAVNLARLDAWWTGSPPQ
jgi:hypothetical protein